MHLMVCRTWSNLSFWQSSAQNNFTVPQEGANVVIPIGNVLICFIASIPNGFMSIINTFPKLTIIHFS